MTRHLLCNQCKTAVATCYGLDSGAGGWGGHYCDTCVVALRMRPVDHAAYPLEVVACPTHGDQHVIKLSTTGGADPYERQHLACGCTAIWLSGTVAAFTSTAGDRQVVTL